MKKRTLFKGLCMTVATSLLAAVLPMGAMAADGVPEAVTVTAEYDTFVRDYKSNLDSSYNEDKTFYVTAKAGNNKMGLLGFDLTQLEKEGYVVDTATLTVAVNGHKRTGSRTEVSEETGESVKVDVKDTGAHSFSVYALGNVDYTTTPAQTYNTALAGKSKTYLSSTVIAPEGTVAQKDKYSFDVSSYFNGPENYTDDYVFAIFADSITDEEKAIGINTVETSFIALDQNMEGYSPSLTVTYKADENAGDDEPSDTDVLSQTIKANADVDIRASKGDATLANKCHEGATTMRSYRNGQWSATGGFPSEAWVRFNLSDIKIPAGKQIDTAKVKIYLQYYNNTDAPKNGGTRYDAAPLDLYAMTAGEYDPATVCWNTEGRPKATGVIATTILCPENVFTQRDAYEFDISEYITSKLKLEGNETFSFYPTNTNKLDVSIYTSEQSEGAYTPELIVTFKDAEPVTSITLPVADSRIVTDYAGQNATSTNTYGLRNFGNAYKSIAKFAFDIYDIDSLIPEGKVIKSAELSYYVTSKSKNSNPTDNVTLQSVRVMNYDDNYWIDPAVKSAEDSLASWTITDEMTGETYNDDTADAIRTGYEFSMSGENWIYDGLAELDYAGQKTVTIDKWFSVDVTEFFMRQMNDEDAMGYVSFALTPSQSENGPVHVANGWNPKAPKLTLHLCDAGEVGELVIGKPEYRTSEANGEKIEQIIAEKRFAAAIPVSGKAETPVNAKIYLAAYSGDELVKIEAHNFDFWQGNGNLYYYFNTPEGTTSVKTFVWTDVDNVPVVETDAIFAVEAE